MTAYEQATATTATSTDRPVSETAKTQASAVAGTAKDEAGTVADTATHAASEVAGTAKEQAAQVAGEAKTQLNTLASQAKSQVADQASAQTQKAAQATRSFADQLQALASGNATQGVATDIVREIGDRVQQIASKLENNEPQELLDEVRRYARNKPGMFLIGAVAAGFVSGRLVKGATAEPDPSDRPVPGGGRYATAGRTGSSGYGGTAAGMPTAGLESPTAGVSYPSSYAAQTYPEEPRPGAEYGGSI